MRDMEGIGRDCGIIATCELFDKLQPHSTRNRGSGQQTQWLAKLVLSFGRVCCKVTQLLGVGDPRSSGEAAKPLKGIDLSQSRAHVHWGEVQPWPSGSVEAFLFTSLVVVWVAWCLKHA